MGVRNDGALRGAEPGAGGLRAPFGELGNAGFEGAERTLGEGSEFRDWLGLR